ncbi:MAG: hypothetical protein P4M14_10290 [Gammaproteobacteria bacterium]|nr:hypothetical protein [Gammaproteobacteria bacterium]
MFETLKKMGSRIDFYASHCYGRIKSCIPLSLFYAVDGVSGGMVKANLKPLWGGKLPAVMTFAYYAFAFFYKAKETYLAHPDSINLAVEEEKLIDTSNMILNKLKQHKNDATAYLGDKDLTMTDSQIASLLCLRDNNDNDMLALYDMLHELHTKIHPHSVSYMNSLLASVLHGITHLNEYLLLKYFAEVDLLDFSSQPTIGLAVLVLGMLSAYQTFSFSLTPRTPSSEELLHCITQDFRIFRDKRNHSLFFSSAHLQADEENVQTTEKVKELAAHNAAQTCYLSCH